MEQTDKMKTQYLEGLTLQQIADLHSTTPMTVSRKLKAAGVEMRRTGRRVTNGERRCTSCKATKPLDQFSRENGQATGFGFYCKACAIQRSAVHHLRKKYGITPAQYQEMVAQQEGRCTICSETPKGKVLFIDHCHVSGRVRGLLCSHCNSAIGFARDNPELLHKMITYIASPLSNLSTDII